MLAFSAFLVGVRWTRHVVVLFVKNRINYWLPVDPSVTKVSTSWSQSRCQGNQAANLMMTTKDNSIKFLSCLYRFSKDLLLIGMISKAFWPQRCGCRTATNTASWFPRHRRIATTKSFVRCFKSCYRRSTIPCTVIVFFFLRWQPWKESQVAGGDGRRWVVDGRTSQCPQKAPASNRDQALTRQGIGAHYAMGARLGFKGRLLVLDRQRISWERQKALPNAPSPGCTTTTTPRSESPPRPSKAELPPCPVYPKK